MFNMFGGSISFNQDLGSWNVSSVTNMSYMFVGSTSFNNGGSSSINGWNVSNVVNMQGMFQSATAFNQNIGSWNVSNVTNFISFMNLKTDLDYSAANLDSIYNTWSTLSLQPGLSVNFGTIKYTSGGSAGKLILTNPPNNWIIGDGGI
jgi:surface protein